jgi:hypothetical protein
MDTSYRFTTETEPSDAQWQALLAAAAQEVQKRAAVLAQKHQYAMAEAISAAEQQWLDAKQNEYRQT